MAVVAAFTGVHGGDELEAAGISGASGGSADRDAAVLEGLAQHFEALAGELGQFVEEEDAAVGQTALAGRNCAPPPASAVELAEWWGLRKGRAVTRPRPAGICPAME